MKNPEEKDNDKKESKKKTLRCTEETSYILFIIFIYNRSADYNRRYSRASKPDALLQPRFYSTATKFLKPQIIDCSNNILLAVLITVLAGGTGSIKIIRGFASGNREQELTIVSNVGDNIWLHGLYICPDIDTVLYGLAGILSDRGWGIKDDTFSCLYQMEKLRQEIWFKLGDRDIATHLLRTSFIRNGRTLTDITDWMAKKYSVSKKIYPATDSRLETIIITDQGPMHIQEFWVKHQGNPKVTEILYNGAENATANPELIDSLKNSALIVLAPANPVTSINPILMVKEIREQLKKLRDKVVAVSPVIGEQAISGPAIKYMKAMKIMGSTLGVAKFYSNIVGNFVIDTRDSILSSEIRSLDMNVFQTDIAMRDSSDERRLSSYIKSLKF
jgi:LPPG:FO 2-phospho-L-lactate transferase